MPAMTLQLSLTPDQAADLLNALEDHRDSFHAKATDPLRGFGLDEEYWSSREKELQALFRLVSSKLKS